ncbi:class I SAM-dependent methyltransferase [Hazenella coriacea]|uniref:Methyltransferase family protein n=1 Tax=Hazenella coriacea TaxID=1179467 RepID=A0A4R3LCB9_9BACL|nr:class I SAM-dependent methyltransferase [Hazenella coriacea]TCS96920.1 methyltransferase family protein [Hazenella coriacea]
MHWYEESFGEDYLLVYRHRTSQSASLEVEQIIDWLNLSSDDLILDLCCGTGRHSRALVKKHLHVVGLDLSTTLLTHAVQETKQAGLSIPFIHGDMRQLPFVNQSFDVVVNLFTSFGYFTKDEDNLKVLTEIARILKPTGRLIIDYMNHQAVKENLVPQSERKENGVQILEQREVQGDYVFKRITISDSHGERKYVERVKMYTLEQMMDLFKQAGLNITHTYGDFKGSPYHQQSDRMIFQGCVE